MSLASGCDLFVSTRARSDFVFDAADIAKVIANVSQQIADTRPFGGFVCVPLFILVVYYGGTFLWLRCWFIGVVLVVYTNLNDGTQPIICPIHPIHHQPMIIVYYQISMVSVCVLV